MTKTYLEALAEQHDIDWTNLTEEQTATLISCPVAAQLLALATSLGLDQANSGQGNPQVNQCPAAPHLPATTPLRLSLTNTS